MKKALKQLETLSDVGEILLFIRDRARSVGIIRQSYHLTPVLEAPVSEQTTIYTEGFSDDWLTLYDDAGFRRHDPIPLRTLRFGGLISWHDAMHLAPNTPEEQRYFAAMEEHGLQYGYGLPLFGSGGREAYASFDFGHLPGKQEFEGLTQIAVLAQTAQLRVSRLLAEQMPVPRLSDREREVLGWMVRGKSGGDIATILGLSPDTVRTYTQRLYEKLETRNRVGAVVKALKLNLIRL